MDILIIKGIQLRKEPTAPKSLLWRMYMLPEDEVPGVSDLELAARMAYYGFGEVMDRLSAVAGLDKAEDFALQHTAGIIVGHAMSEKEDGKDPQVTVNKCLTDLAKHLSGCYEELIGNKVTIMILVKEAR